MSICYSCTVSIPSLLFQISGYSCIFLNEKNPLLCFDPRKDRRNISVPIFLACPVQQGRVPRRSPTDLLSQVELYGQRFNALLDIYKRNFIRNCFGMISKAVETAMETRSKKERGGAKRSKVEKEKRVEEKDLFLKDCLHVWRTALFFMSFCCLAPPID
ncbi:hypothetical protein ATANTOWER_006363 [Ataeniobius toweri]|uniref:Uncharacterized protein n=1 Tax=Ataeniobius toweri TaxID=208326 RepID=A0ABU7CFX4_9TELE|nr:hypothetical protein [Ataeniobius toweri]